MSCYDFNNNFYFEFVWIRIRSDSWINEDFIFEPNLDIPFSVPQTSSISRRTSQNQSHLHQEQGQGNRGHHISLKHTLDLGSLDHPRRGGLFGNSDASRNNNDWRMFWSINLTLKQHPEFEISISGYCPITRDSEPMKLCHPRTFMCSIYKYIYIYILYYTIYLYYTILLVSISIHVWLRLIYSTYFCSYTKSPTQSSPSDGRVRTAGGRNRKCLFSPIPESPSYFRNVSCCSGRSAFPIGSVL